MNKTYTIEEFASLMRITRNTVESWIRNGNIKANKVKQQWEIPESEYIKFLDQQIHGCAVGYGG